MQEQCNIEAEYVDFLDYCKSIHIEWAEYFEANPEMEASYIATDDWDSAERHRELAHQYQKTIDYINTIQTQLVEAAAAAGEYKE